MARQKETIGSRTFPVAVMLTLAGGYLDAYTYSARGKVFANAQTGNIVKLVILCVNINGESVDKTAEVFDIDVLCAVLHFIIKILSQISKADNISCAVG